MESFIDSGALQLWVADEGDGIPIVLSSGGPGCCDYLGPVAELLRPGFRTIRYDARGCGRSSATSDFTLENSLADLEAIRTSLDIDRWVTLGHSAGCELSLAYAIAFPERVTALICLSGGRVVDDRGWHAVYSAGRDEGREPPLDFAYPPNMEANSALNADWKRYIHRPELLRDLAGLRVPALFVYGSDDIRPAWPAEQIAALIPGAKFEMLQGADHHLWLTHAEELRGELSAFLASISV
ncbi:MAG: alpha/beta hydrolase [bacterium]